MSCSLYDSLIAPVKVKTEQFLLRCSTDRLLRLVPVIFMRFKLQCNKNVYDVVDRNKPNLMYIFWVWHAGPL